MKLIKTLLDSTDSAAVAKTAVGAGATGAFIFGLDAQIVGIIGGLVLGLCGLVYQVWSNERLIRLQKARNKTEQALLTSRGDQK